MTKKSISLIIILVSFVTSCTYDKPEPEVAGTGYPVDIEGLIINKCATSGCHNELSYNSCAGLSLVNWDKMFEGSNSGAVAIPFRSDYSTLCFFTNIDSSKGLILLPTMPNNQSPLTSAEYDLLRDWIVRGAPDKTGFIKFSDNPSRQKLYIANQAVNEIAVLDINSGLLMRYNHVGLQPFNFCRTVAVSPDNQFWYAILSGGDEILKFRTSDNNLEANISIGTGAWNTIAISSDSKRAYVVELNVPGKVACLDLENNTLTDTWQNFQYPHGAALNRNNDTLYLTAQNGNFIYKIPVNDHLNFSYVVIDSTTTVWSTSSVINPHQILFSNDFSKYYLTCQNSNEVRVMRTSDDKLLTIIPTPDFPAEMSISKTHPYLFVSCMNTLNDSTTVKGRVYVINTNTDNVVSSINTGHQPRGLAVCDENNLVYVANRNSSHGGPASHHSTPGSKNGYITAIDMNALQLIDYKCEVAVDPYTVSLSH